MVPADPYYRLRPAPPTPANEICSCPSGTPVKLMSSLGPNPIHCLECNGEVEPERVGLDGHLADAIADWHWTYGAISRLELDSAEYEEWATRELLDPSSPPNRQGLALARRLDSFVRSYFWFFWQEGSGPPPSTCPVCGGTLSAHASGIFPQLLCERDSVVLAGR